MAKSDGSTRTRVARAQDWWRGVVLVSPEDQWLLEARSWGLNNYGYVVHQRSRAGGAKPSSELLHRTITNCPAGKVVDHINGNKLDNRRENLRICDSAENIRNRGSHKNSRTGVKNVGFNTKTGRWYVSIQANLKRLRRKGFRTFEEAERLAIELEADLHKEFASRRSR